MALAVHPGRDFHRWFAVILAAALAAAAAACPRVSLAEGAVGAAASAASSVTVIDSLVVTAGTLPDPGFPSSAGLVTRLELREGDEGRDVPGILAGMAGLQMARTGGWGTTAVPSLRGSAPAQIRFFLDGMPLPDAQSGLAGFSLVPLARLEAVEVHRGVVPAGLGGIGGAGAVDFLTRGRDEGIDLDLHTGAWGARGARLSAGGGNADGSRSGLLTVHGLRIDNDFSYLDHNQTFNRADDDTVRARGNADLREWGIWGRGHLATAAADLNATAGFVRREGGRPGPLGFPSPHARVRSERADLHLKAALVFAPVTVDVAAGRGLEILEDPRGEVGFAPPGQSRSTGEDLTLRGVWRPVLLPNRLKLETGVSWRGQWQTDTFAATTDPRRNRRETSLFAALTATAPGGRLQATPAVRWLHTRDDFPPVPAFPWLPEEEAVNNLRDDVSPSLGAVWTLRPERMFLSAHASRTVRPPSWVELFGHRGGIDGNRELTPEDITAADLAWSLRAPGRASLRVALYWAETRDKIVFVQNSQRTSHAVNLGRARVRGLEMEAAASLSEDLELTANLTLQQAEDTGPDPAYHGNELPFLPPVEGHVRLDRAWGSWRPDLTVSFMGANYRDRANTALDRAPARTVIDAGLSRSWSARWLGSGGDMRVRLEVANLTDNTIYDVEGFPLPGRSWRLSARIRR